MSSLLIGPFRDGAVIAATPTVTVVKVWDEIDSGELTGCYAHSLDNGAATVSVYILPEGVSPVADEHIIGPKNAPIPVNTTLDWEISNPLPLNFGDQIVAVADIASAVTVMVCTRKFIHYDRGGSGEGRLLSGPLPGVSRVPVPPTRPGAGAGAGGAAPAP